MPALSPSRRNVMLLALLLFGQLLLMAGGAGGRGQTTQVESWMMRLSAPFVNLAGALGAGVRGTAGGVGSLFASRTRSRELEADVRRLESEVTRYREAALENERLRRLLSMREELAPRSIGASVVTARLSSEAMMIVIDRGSDQGVRVDAPVVAWGGAVGHVVSVERRYAKVRLLADPSSGAGALVQRSRAQGVALGHGRDPLDLAYLPHFADVVHGDRVVTSGLDGIFPRGFGIGHVVAVSDLPDGGRAVQLEPEVDYRTL
ncbi:MAG TPA: rod shape-determining protein MreC, partial [Candidatus Polarisedimenticolaceae bacterium]|nr:rod shape-determining protein MreC [Candidatus Polarisedimenticolaceae bacterium]